MSEKHATFVSEINHTLATMKAEQQKFVYTVAESPKKEDVDKISLSVKELRDAYNADLLRVERNNRDAMDSVAADLMKNINDVKSDTLENKVELMNVKEKLEMVSNDMSDIKEYVERSVIPCD
jgi:hypothetical protein